MRRLIPPLWSGPITDYLTALRAAGHPPTTVETRRGHLARVAGAFPDRSPWEVTTDQLVSWTGEQAWAVETRRSYRTTLRSFYRWAVESGRAEANPATRLPKVKASPPNPRPASDVAYRTALMAARPRERLMVRLAAEMGLRRAEVAGVHSRDVVDDLTGSSLIVHGKGRKVRLVPMPASIAAELRTLPDGYAFPGQFDGHLSPRWVGKIVGRLLPEGVTMHALRHRFATRAYAVDRDVFTVQELLGHASPATTRAYVQVPDDAKRRLVDAVAA